MLLLRASFFLFAVFLFPAGTSAEDGEAKQKIFLYPGKARSERDLQTCAEYEVCSIVHKRFWYPRSVERFCRCADKECPATWTETPDNYTMMANNRAQMKFCEPVVDLPNCLDGNETTRYLTIKNTTIHTVEITESTEFPEVTEDYKITSTASCYCPAHNKWICSSLESNSSTLTTVTRFRCASLTKCNPGEFCGSERRDYYSVYYHCSCPVGHLCIRDDHTHFQTTQIFYHGGAYKAHCTSFSPVIN